MLAAIRPLLALWIKTLGYELAWRRPFSVFPLPYWSSPSESSYLGNRLLLSIVTREIHKAKLALFKPFSHFILSFNLLLLTNYNNYFYLYLESPVKLACFQLALILP